MVCTFSILAKIEDVVVKYSDFFVAWQRYGAQMLQNLSARDRFYSKLQEVYSTPICLYIIRWLRVRDSSENPTARP